MKVPFSDLAGLENIDCCIIGAGPAGITCARTMAAKGRKVLLLEAGDEDVSQESQELYEGDTKGDPYFPLDAVRLRFFGGTSNHWKGSCRPLDAIDFEGKGPTHLGEWPIRKADLDPFFDRAAEILEIKRPAEDVVLPGGKLKQIEFVTSPPVRFREKYLQEILASANILLCLNCNLTRINTSAGAVSSISVQNYQGQSADIRAAAFVLACGGIENSRLLLWSNIQSNGELLKRRAGLVGHYWFDHPVLFVGAAIVPTNFMSDSSIPAVKDDWYFFAPTPELMSERGILNCGLRVFPSPHGELRELVEDVACIAPTWANWAYDQLRDNTLCGWRLKAAWEQEPRFENCVALGGAKDKLGIPRVELHWRKSALDLKTVRETTVTFATYLAEQDIGRARLIPWVLGEGDYPSDDEPTGYHLMGGTRMGDDPTLNIVDRDCRLFDVANLYVAGSSVFPSTGHANPTLTITQLALRLADHLAAGK